MISVCIPTHNMKDKGFFFNRTLEALDRQTFRDFEIIVTDDSEDDIIEILSLEWKNHFNRRITYSRNGEVLGMAGNTNEAMHHATGDLVKILYLDDYLAHSHALQDINDNFEGHWMVTGCLHDDGSVGRPHTPYYNDNIHMGQNTIGSPSVLTMKRESIMYFDPEMTWVLDCDLYKRLYDAYGEPTILDSPNVVIGIGYHQTTHLLTDEKKIDEIYYSIKKHENKA